ncbi:unnamed protein product [Oppiella nova]|uniref:Uncharacterized protein n=1 Tax=Oppiella nova TaxID=334625 RepID=A0A7R9QJI3_9ACAR|nr:unnamed protein product [Oppiella nova]CAG2167088.1 unnamed protein product [Oppiella nova]
MSVTYDFHDLSGKVALITGSSSGIGAATAELFAQSGADVVVTGLYADSGLSAVANRCRSLGAKVLEMAADLTHEDEARALVDQTIETFGKIDVLFNCAGMPVKFVGITNPSFMEAYRLTMRVDLDMAVYMTYLCVGHLEKTRGVIINMSSASLSAPYCMARTAVDMFTRCMAAELGGKGIRVNSVNPSVIETDFLKSTGVDPKVMVWPKVWRISCRSGGVVEDVAQAVLFLSAPESSFITGTQMLVDSGHIAAGVGYNTAKASANSK